MTQFGYQASHEQFPPSELLKLVQQAEAAGFEACNSSDHIAPWSSSQGHSGFAFAWLGAAMQATKLTFGMVTSPGFRYHPAVLAQAVATLEEMFPGRFFLNLGSGEALNEHVTGQPWPIKPVRNEILRESAEVMRRLWRGEEVTHHGRVTVEQAKLYVRLPRVPDIIGAALTEPTARWLGGWADGMITTARPIADLRRMIDAFREGGGEGKRLVLKADLSYDTTDEEALEGAWEQWRYPLISAPVLGELKTVALFDAVGGLVDRETVQKSVRIGSSPAQFVDWLGELAGLGFEKIILHNVNRKQEPFLEMFGAQVLPQLRGSANHRQPARREEQGRP